MITTYTIPELHLTRHFAALLGGCVPESARRRVPIVLMAVIGSYL